MSRNMISGVYARAETFYKMPLGKPRGVATIVPRTKEPESADRPKVFQTLNVGAEVDAALAAGGWQNMSMTGRSLNDTDMLVARGFKFPHLDEDVLVAFNSATLPAYSDREEEIRYKMIAILVRYDREANGEPLKYFRSVAKKMGKWVPKTNEDMELLKAGKNPYEIQEKDRILGGFPETGKEAFASA
ncbi:MAG: hypothetical protein IJG13_04585 [Kiritimatiellae bacterium]|nr:hypothetical protein [Kiritimatiellia bacterium]MBQ6327822.1 hypothetical protein [Kiritimatiellia bacterium]